MDEEGDTGLTVKPVQVVTCIRNVSPHQDGCWSWLVCFAAVVSNVVICGFTFSYGILFPAILDEFQQGKARSAWVGSIAMMGIGIYGPLIARLYRRFGARAISFVGTIICAVSLAVTSKVTNLYLMYLTYGLLFGFGSGGIYLVTYIVVPRYFKKWRSLSLGLIAMGPGGGMFIMSPVVHELFVRFGWRGTFLAMAGIVSVTCISAFVYKPIEPDSDVKEENSDSAKSDKFWDVKILQQKVFVLVTIAGFVYYLGHYTPTLHMVRFLEGRGVQESRAARLYIYSCLSSLLIRPMIGRLNDVTWINMFYIYSIATGVECVVTFLLPFAITNLSLVLYFVVFGLADGAMGCGLPIAVINSLPEKMRPLGIGAYNCLSCFASACGPALGGLVADIERSYVPMFNMVGALITAGTAMLIAVSCMKKSESLSPISGREIA
ncbi:monocarboxylate transporter 4 [Pocillopora verrucosa]|uniref:monocarboxylate transporter 4 n=1 Tax=Pocillopora verrucosa TaxID=203993 RepID=UPI003342B681